MYDFGALLKKLRIEHNMTQEQLGQTINRTKTVVSKYENGLLSPTMDTLIVLSIVFNVSLDYLAGINKESAISLQGLTPEQESILQRLAQQLRAPDATDAGLSEAQLALLSSILVEFTKKR